MVVWVVWPAPTTTCGAGKPRTHPVEQVIQDTTDRSNGAAATWYTASGAHRRSALMSPDDWLRCPRFPSLICQTTAGSVLA